MVSNLRAYFFSQNEKKNIYISYVKTLFGTQVQVTRNVRGLVPCPVLFPSNKTITGESKCLKKRFTTFTWEPIL